MEKIVLAYSGGLDTSAIIPWLIETYNAEVYAYCADLGNGPNFEELEKNAKAYGAKEVIIEDLKQNFAKDFIYPLLKTSAIYQDEYLLGTAIARPLIAERVAHWAKKLGATSISHGATGKGNDQIRFEKSWAYLVPNIKIIAPWKIWSFKGRSDLVNYLSEKGFPYEVEGEKYSEDVNLLHRSCEGLELEEITNEYDQSSVLKWIDPDGEKHHSLKIQFKKGLISEINNKKVSPLEAIEYLNSVGSETGIGIADIVEDRLNGIKSRGIYETPAGTIYHYALKQLKNICWSKSTILLCQKYAIDYAQLVYDGDWHSVARTSLSKFFDESSTILDGEISLELHKGKMKVIGRSSLFSLYDPEVSSFEKDPYDIYGSATGFCKTVTFSSYLEGNQKVNYYENSK